MKPALSFIPAATIAVLLLSLLSGCSLVIEHRPYHPQHITPSILPAEPSSASSQLSVEQPLTATQRAPFAYQLLDQTVERREQQSNDENYRFEHIHLRSTIKRNGQTSAQQLVIEAYWQPDPTAPGIVVLPIFGGSYKVARHFADYFAKRGFSAFIVHRDAGLKEKICSNLDNASVNMVQRQQQAIDWLAPQVKRLGVFGISAGGMKATMLTALEPRLQASVIALAGLNAPHTCAHSNEGRIVKEREQSMDEYGFDVADYQAWLEQQQQLKLADYARSIDPARVLQFIALRDSAVPTITQQELWQTLGQPEAHFLPTGHRSSLLFVPYVRSKSLGFFERLLMDK